MTVPVAVSRRTVLSRAARIQREHELNEALKAARHLQARLEMLGNRSDEVASIRALRDSLTDELVNGPPCQPSSDAEATPIGS